jgi:hypothetical protein
MRVSIGACTRVRCASTLIRRAITAAYRSCARSHAAGIVLDVASHPARAVSAAQHVTHAVVSIVPIMPIHTLSVQASSSAMLPPPAIATTAATVIASHTVQLAARIMRHAFRRVVPPCRLRRTRRGRYACPRRRLHLPCPRLVGRARAPPLVRAAHVASLLLLPRSSPYAARMFILHALHALCIARPSCAPGVVRSPVAPCTSTARASVSFAFTVPFTVSFTAAFTTAATCPWIVIPWRPLPSRALCVTFLHRVPIANVVLHSRFTHLASLRPPSPGAVVPHHAWPITPPHPQ